MILLRIITEKENVIVKITEELLKKKLVATVNVDKDRDRYEMVNDEVIVKTIHVITATTKALLFEDISKLILDIFPEENVEIFSSPIVHIDWKTADSLIQSTKKV